jgi:hypothetical protein
MLVALELSVPIHLHTKTCQKQHKKGVGCLFFQLIKCMSPTWLEEKCCKV